MQPQINQATQELNPTYNQAVQGIQTQVPAIQQLYSALLQGLQGQQQMQTQALGNSIAQRGLTQPSLQGQLGAMLGGEVNLQGAQLGAQQAQQVAGLQQQVGQANIGRATAIADQAGALQKQALESQSNQMQMTDIERKAQLEQQQNQRQFEIQKAQYQAAQARAAAKAKSENPVSMSDLERALRLTTDRSYDGKHANPHVLGKAYAEWMKQGFSEQDFWSRFQGWWNPEDSSYNDSFQRTVKYELGR